MTREQKIEALAEEYGKNSRHLKTSTHFRDGMLAGIALRDEELLAMEFDARGANNSWWFADGNKDEPREVQYMEGARWQFEQFIKAIKGDEHGNIRKALKATQR